LKQWDGAAELRLSARYELHENESGSGSNPLLAFSGGLPRFGGSITLLTLRFSMPGECENPFEGGYRDALRPDVF
jgi:hypothetical protein